jgi:hypothetical protein
MLDLTKEAEAKLKTLAECLNLSNESYVIDELFYQFLLDQQSDKRTTIMMLYKMNLERFDYALPKQ